MRENLDDGDKRLIKYFGQGNMDRTIAGSVNALCGNPKITIASLSANIAQ